MNRQNLKILLYTLLILAAAPWGTNFAQAGPGGGTYYANSPAGGTSGPALRKFVDSLPGVGPANANNLGQYIPIATPVTGKPGVPNDGDYYEIGVVEYAEKMHSDLPKKTKLRGYVDLNPVFGAVSSAHNRAHYLGPMIVAQKDRPVRVKLTNMLPTGAAGNLFIPTDTSIMGSGIGPLASNGTPCSVLRPDPSNPTIMVSESCTTNASYTQNRANLHLHGGNTPWISDGTPHQWTAPAGETTPYKKGVSTRDVPDMPATAAGQMTFFYTNQQSSRLMWYHDHTLGLTRLNVYSGEVAPFLLTDPTEEGLINSGVLPNAGGVYRYGIPLIIQDKTFVPKDVNVQDALWTTSSKGVANNWGIFGDLWFPHVYEPNQDPTSPAGANPFGRWDYGPWFWPPISIAADRSTIPEPTTTPEGFHDTMLVNGTAYPYLTVEPKAYRFRILNGANDRSLNLSLFYADPSDPSGKEVKMVPAGPNPAFPAGWPTDGRAGGVPDPGTVGPNIVQIGSESGLLPFPVIHPNQPVNYNYNRRDIVVLNVQEKNLFLGTAERADVVIDFSSVPPGSTLILYNDAPAPTPASDPRYDYYTGNQDMTSSGGAPSTVRGYGPNTRTVMQFRVAGTPGTPLNLAALQSALPVAFKASQPAPLVTQPTLPVASGGYSPTEQYAKIQDYSITLTPLNSDYTPKYSPPIPVTIPFHPKAIQELWDPYGRMNATLGIELPFTNQFNQTTLPMGFAEPTTETTTDGQPQIWKITHNGVDTHPVHFHMVDVQVVNRVGWDGAIRPPDDNELGWKETVRMNPLEDIIVAMRPKEHTLPGSWIALNPDANGLPLPKSIRVIDPVLPPDARIIATDFGNIPVDPPGSRAAGTPAAGVVTTVANNDPNLTDYGYEYVWHCHILGHEENDFMRPFVFRVSNAAPLAPTFNTGGTPNVDQGGVFKGGATVPGKLNYIVPYTNPNINQVVLQWNDGALDPQAPSSFIISRATGAGALARIAEVTYLPGYPPIYTDTSVNPGTQYSYQVTAFNAKGSTAASDGPVSVTTGTWTNATGVTLVDSKPIGHVVGSNVQFTATGSGATVTQPFPVPVPPLAPAYQYRFLLNNVEVQAFSTLRYWTLPDTTPVGTYTIKVEARTSPAQAPVASTSVTHVVNNPAQPPVTVSTPAPGIYTTTPVTVTLTASTASPPATIFYTTDGSIPDTTTLTTFTNSGSIIINATTTINYFARDVNGVVEPVHSDTWYAHTLDMTSSILINGGATATNNPLVTLNLSAVDPAGVSMMQFSNDNITYSAEEPFLSTKSWTLTAGDGLKTVYVRFRDKSLPQPGGYLYPAISAQITFDTVPPITAASPLTGTYPPVTVTLTPNEPATVYYTTDGSTPTAASTVYTVPILLAATTTLKYFSVDTAGNAEIPKSAVYTINIANLTASVKINGGAPATNSANVNLTLSAATSISGGTITGMQFSNDGTTYSAQEGYATTKSWQLLPGDGPKTVYVKFIETNLVGTITYPPVSANIVLDTVAPATTASPIPGSYGTNPVPIALSSSEIATIYYTNDGSVPTTNSPVYTGPITVLTATPTTLKYFAVDTAGNIETVKEGTWTFHTPDMVASVTINNGQSATKVVNVTMQLSATDVVSGTAEKMQFSNDGTSFTPEEPYATTKTWNLTSGDGIKTVYVRFREKASAGGTLYDPVTAQIVLDTVVPATTASPIPGSYGTNPVPIALSSSEIATIYYTTDGSVPSTTSSMYTGPITVPTATPTTLKYFAVDTAGNMEPVKEGTWTFHTPDMVASVKIDNGQSATKVANVTLQLSATDVVSGTAEKMQFSNDGISFTPEEPYATAKSWNLISGDGIKTVYVRFREKASAGGTLYDPVTAQIVLDTVAPVTLPGLIPGTFSGAVQVALTANEPATIYYTLDGSDPTTTANPARVTYSTAIAVSATTTINYSAVDPAGNVEAVKSGTWTIHTPDMVASVQINNNDPATNNPVVTLQLNAVDSQGISKMQFSNDGTNYSAEESFPTGATATSKTWILASGDGAKSVYVRFRDGSGLQYPPVTASIILDTVSPVTAVTPIPGTYASAPVAVTLAVNESSAKTYFTTDGSSPTTTSTEYTTPIIVSSSTTIKYFSVDVAGNVESVNSGSWVIHSSDLVSSIKINNGALRTNSTSASLDLSAVDPTGIATMQFSNDGVTYTAEETYATAKSWVLTPLDGIKTVYVRFRDKSLPTGNLYDPIFATIVLDTVAPVTSVSPIPGTYATSPVNVILTTNEASTIYYTTDGTTPNTGSSVYSAPIVVTSGTTINYFSVDTAGNIEVVHSGTWNIHHPDMVVGVKINNGDPITNNATATLSVSANDGQGVVAIQFSNDGVNYSPEEPFTAAPGVTGTFTKTWPLAGSDGTNTVYVRLRDGSLSGGVLYGPFISTITYGLKDGMLSGTSSYLGSALKALQIAKGLVAATNLDLAHADVAPYINGTPVPDGKIDLNDVYILLLRATGLVPL
jgi:FtsP/CotA-like multicopper oxidase with cupredoxin domain